MRVGFSIIFVSNFQDRDQYIASLESHIEECKSSNLHISLLSQQIHDLTSRIDRIDSLSSTTVAGRGVAPEESHAPGETVPRKYAVELDIIKMRLKLLEEAADHKKPLIRFPHTSIEQVMERVDEVEINCARLTEDALATVQGLHEELGTLRASIEESSKKDIKEVETRLHEMLSDGVEKIAAVLRKVVAVQKSQGPNSHAAISPSRARSLSKNDRRKLIEELHREINFLERL